LEEKITYSQSGVDTEKAGRLLSEFSKYQKDRTINVNVLGGVGPFAACYDLQSELKKLSHPVLVSACDGVGTKLKLALQWNHINGLGQDLVAMSVNDLLCVGATPTVFLDYFATSKLEQTTLLSILKSVQSACEMAGCSLAGGETAEMPGLYQKNDFDLAGFTVGFVDKEAILGPLKVKAGNKLIAIEASGLHSNGYSLVRKIIEREDINPLDKTPFGSLTWKETLLLPTTIYVENLKGSLPQMNALAHITGGGLFENLPRVLPKGTIANISSSDWKIPELFRWFQEKARLTDKELLSTFNCGTGMIAICEEEKVENLMKEIQSTGPKCTVVGTVEKNANMKADPQVVWK